MISELERHLAEVGGLCRRYGVARLDLFGSAATGSFQPGLSDLDFLVAFSSPEAPGYAARYFGLLESLGALFGRRVDLVVEAAIRNPYFRESVERTRARLYEA